MNPRSKLMSSPAGVLKNLAGGVAKGRSGTRGARQSAAAGPAVELPDLLSTSVPFECPPGSPSAIACTPERWGALRFISLLAFSPWLAFLLLSLFTAPERAWSFVAACTWIGTPILVICAGMFGLDRHHNAANP